MMCVHCLQRLDDRCPGLCTLWLTGCVSMWLRRVGSNPSSVVARRLSAVGVVAWLRRNGYWVRLELVWS